MIITTVAYGHTFNLGNYRSQRIDLTATLGQGDDPTEAYLLLKADVLRLGGDEQGAREAERAAERRRLELAPRRAEPPTPAPADAPQIMVGDAITAATTATAALYHEEVISIVGLECDPEGRTWFVCGSDSDDDFPWARRDFAIRTDALAALVAAGEFDHHRLPVNRPNAQAPRTLRAL